MTISKAGDFGKWYQELVVKSEMIEYSDISGARRRYHVVFRYEPEFAMRHCTALQRALLWSGLCLTSSKSVDA